MSKKSIWACEYPKKELEEQLSERYGEYDEELKNLIKGCTSKIGDIIEVNDWDARAKITKKGIAVSLVVEEDGSVRWYLNPDENSDWTIRGVNVKKIGRR